MYFTEYELVLRLRDGQCSTTPPASPANGQNGGILDPSMSNDYINRLKLLQMQENGDLHRLQQTHDDVKLFRNPDMSPASISLLMNRAQAGQLLRSLTFILIGHRIFDYRFITVIRRTTKFTSTTSLSTVLPQFFFVLMMI